MYRSIAFTGKGGVGKTTSLVLCLKFLIANGNYNKIWVIDADPDANVADLVGKNVHFENTIGGKMHEIMKRIKMKMLAPYKDSKQAIEAEIFNCFLHFKDFDLIEMGRTEGEGCYCSVNNVLKNAFDIISETYDLVLVDTPAGLEHFARKTTKDVSDLIIIVDPSKMAFHTLKQILDISKEVTLNFQNYWILGNKFLNNNWDVFKEKVKMLTEIKIKLLGWIPENAEIMKYNLFGKNLLDLPNNNEAYNKAKRIFRKIIS